MELVAIWWQCKRLVSRQLCTVKENQVTRCLTLSIRNAVEHLEEKVRHFDIKDTVMYWFVKMSGDLVSNYSGMEAKVQ
jgi:hypothetical protein